LLDVGGTGGRGSLELYMNLNAKKAKKFNEIVKNRSSEPHPEACRGQPGEKLELLFELR